MQVVPAASEENNRSYPELDRNPKLLRTFLGVKIQMHIVSINKCGHKNRKADEEKEIKNEQQRESKQRGAQQRSTVLPAVSVGVYLYVISCPAAVTQTRGSLPRRRAD